MMKVKILPDISIPVHMYVNNELFTHVTADTFGDMIDRFMGYEAAKFYREMLADSEEYCTEECDRLYDTQEHYRSVIREALDILDKVEVKKAYEKTFDHAYSILHLET